MEEEFKNIGNKKKKWQIIIPIFLAIVIVGVFIYLDYKNKPKPGNEPNGGQTSVYRPQPVLPSENPKRATPLDPNKVAYYGCAGPQDLEAATIKEPDQVWEIKKDGSTNKINLGKYRINTPVNSFFDIKKLWLYFYSEELSEREDGIYAPEGSYVSRMFIVVNDYEKEIKLGGDEYMLIELDYPLGDLYPYDQAAVLEFELIIEFKCKNIKDGTCLDNTGKSLEYLNNKEIISQVRLFAKGCQDFDDYIEIEATFKY